MSPSNSSSLKSQRLSPPPRDVAHPYRAVSPPQTGTSALIRQLRGSQRTPGSIQPLGAVPSHTSTSNPSFACPYGQPNVSSSKAYPSTHIPTELSPSSASSDTTHTTQTVQNSPQLASESIVQPSSEAQSLDSNGASRGANPSTPYPPPMALNASGFGANSFDSADLATSAGNVPTLAVPRGLPSEGTNDQEEEQSVAHLLHSQPDTIVLQDINMSHAPVSDMVQSDVAINMNKTPHLLLDRDVNMSGPQNPPVNPNPITNSEDAQHNMEGLSDATTPLAHPSASGVSDTPLSPSSVSTSIGLSPEVSSLLRGVGIVVQEGVKQGVKEAVEIMTTPSKPSRTEGPTSHQNDIVTFNDESSDSSGEGFVSKRKASGEKTEEAKSFHTMLADYLKKKELWCTHVSKDNTPASKTADKKDVKSFEDDNNAGPTLDNPVFDWASKMDSMWNDQLLYNMAVDIIPQIKDTEDLTFPAQYRNITFVKKVLADKLYRTRTAYQDKLPPSERDLETAEEKAIRVENEKLARERANRRRTRRLNTFNRRKAIIQARSKESKEDQVFWKQVKEVLVDLGSAGMSSDETEQEEDGFSPKVVRRVPKYWLDDRVSLLWDAVDRYGKGLKRRRPGNAPIRRLRDASMSVDMAYTKLPRTATGLPANYYSDLWWKSLSKARQQKLMAKPAKFLPSFDHLFKS